MPAVLDHPTEKIPINFVKSENPTRPGWEYFLPKEEKQIIEQLRAPLSIPTGYDRPFTQVTTLFPKDTVQGHTGKGYYMINVDGFRAMNAYVISDPLNSTTQRGFTLQLSFALNDFVYGVGVVGESAFFFNFEDYFDPGNFAHKTVRCETSDLITTGGLPWIGGRDLTHILRVPVLGPYVRASVFNEDTTTRKVEVKAYLTT